MISLDTASQLHRAGLTWVPQLLDYFGIPDRNLEDHIFVISDMLVTVDRLQGMQVVSFQGASEWALDYLVTSEAVWIPREDQLRQALEAVLLAHDSPALHFTSSMGSYRLEFQLRGEEKRFEGDDGSKVYASALLSMLEAQQSGGIAGPVQGSSG